MSKSVVEVRVHTATCYSKVIPNVVIRRNWLLYQIWHYSVVLCNIFSPYYYMYLITVARIRDLSFRQLPDFILTFIFLADMILNFFVEKEVQTPEQLIIERDPKKIAWIYLTTDFLFDLVTVIPFQTWLSHLAYNEYLFFLKIFRVRNGILNFNAQLFIEKLRELSKTRVQNMIENDFFKAHDKTKNHTFISQLVLTLQLLKIFEGFIWLTFLSYTLGILFYIFCIL